MNPAFVVRFRPNGPWRIGPDSGARDRVDCVLHSDTLFSAVTHAMARMGRLDEWLAAMVADPAGPPVRLSSCFPYLNDLRLAPPPRSLWPPAASTKVRWRSARFIPLSAVASLVADQALDENRWFVDGPSGCLLPDDEGLRSGPFRPAVRSYACVDRLGRGVETHRAACIEFAPGGGLWAVAGFLDESAAARWSDPVKAAFRLLADTGIGGERAIGWGRSDSPEFLDGSLPDLVLPPVAETRHDRPVDENPDAPEPTPRPAPETAWWLLSLFSPAAGETIEWQRGSYSLVTRGGRVESAVASGAAKKVLRMVEEGSVIVSEGPPRGASPDVAPDGFAHPVYRFGAALALPVPLRFPDRPMGAL